MTIPFIDLRQVNMRFKTAFQNDFKILQNSGRYIMGESLSAFEEEFAAFCGTKHTIGVGNGLDALTLIFESYIQLGRLKTRDKILVPAHTYMASIMAIIKAGLVPVLVEPNIDTFNIDFNDMRAKMTPQVKAVMAVHMYGFLVDTQALKSFCRDNNLICIEDAAQAHGAMTAYGERAGSIGAAAGFSFYPTKNLGALGDGGAVTTNDDELAKMIRQLRDYGRINRDESVVFGVNSRLDDIQASFLSTKLKVLDDDNGLRRAVANRYIREIQSPFVATPTYSGDLDHVWHIFAIRSAHRNILIDHLKNHGIAAMVHYPIPPHRQKALSPFIESELPVSDNISQTQISLPISPVMTDDQVSMVINAVNAFRV